MKERRLCQILQSHDMAWPRAFIMGNECGYLDNYFFVRTFGLVGMRGQFIPYCEYKNGTGSSRPELTIVINDKFTSLGSRRECRLPLPL